jgi:xanthine dehydrogenase accessory factor
MTGAEVAAALARAGRGVMALIAQVRGSAPRDAGAAMLVTADATLGSVGGGTVEWRALETARAMLADPGPAPATVEFPLNPALDQCCGGRIRLAFAPLTAANAPRFAAGAPVALWEGGPFWTPDPPRRAVHVYGAGHVGAALVRALAPLPFAIRWIDARAGVLADPPPGVETIETPLPEAEAEAARAPDALHLVMTHSHAVDLEIVAAALEAGAGFVGLIGSATKRATFLSKLRARGLAEARLAALVCPIGLPSLRDKRPAVIAASVAADLLLREAAAAARRGAA